MTRKLLLLLLLPTLGCASTKIERIVEKTEPKVVKVGLVLKNGYMGTCSGAFIDSWGTVLTCAHCVSHPKITKIFVKLSDGSFYRGTVTKIDIQHDLALISMIRAEPTSYFKLGQEVNKGQQVLSFGSPMGLQGTVSVGWVQNIKEYIYLRIFHSASINPGNSGGPLVDLSGRLVGINEAHLLLNPFSVTDSLSVAIDIKYIRAFLGVQ